MDRRAEASIVRLEATKTRTGLYRHRAVRYVFDLRRATEATGLGWSADPMPPPPDHGRRDFSKR